MGYILPIIPFQLMQHAERELKVRHNPYQFVPTPIVKNELTYPTFVDEEQAGGSRGTQSPKTGTDKQKKADEAIYAKITGKGISIDTCA